MKRIPQPLFVIGMFGTLLANAACDDLLDDIATLDAEIECPIDECGVNSPKPPVVDEVLELHWDSAANTGDSNVGGFALGSFTGPGGDTSCTFSVAQGDMTANCGGVPLTGGELIGSELTIIDNHGQAVLVLVVVNQEVDLSWTNPQFGVSRYVFGIRDSELDTVTSMCNQTSDFVAEDAWSVLMTRERYDWTSYSVSSTGEDADGWFAIACMRNALYKIKMSGHDSDPPASSPVQSTVEHRQAMMKMLAGDYCGTGQAFTVAGQPLQWVNTEGTIFNYPEHTDGISESLWDANGATCLDTPRLGTSKLPAILSACQAAGKTLPTCTTHVGEDAWESRIPVL